MTARFLMVAGAGSLALAACQHKEPGVEIRLVPTPTPVPCLTADKIPAEPAPVGDRLTGVPAADLPIVTARALDLLSWGRQMHAALVACAS